MFDNSFKNDQYDDGGVPGTSSESPRSTLKPICYKNHNNHKITNKTVKTTAINDHSPVLLASVGIIVQG